MYAKMTNSSLRSVFVDSTYHIKVQCFPNNEIAIRLKPWVKGTGDNAIDRENKFTALQLENNTKNDAVRCLIGAKDDTKKDLVLQKPGWGLLPKERYFNKRIQQNILRRVAALQVKFGRQNMRFLTLTLPGSTEESMIIMAKYSAYIVNRINRFFSNIIGKDAQNRVQVWEFQKRRALHSHIVIASKNEVGLKRIDSEFKMFCYRLFCELSEITGIDMFARKGGGTWYGNFDVLKCDSQVVRKDASAYMSKYMGKSNDKTHDDTTGSVVYYPSVWATWGRGATRAFRERTWRLKDKRISADIAEKVALKVIECSEKYGQEKYKEPLIYLDRVGYGVNIKAYVKPNYLEEYMDEIQGILELSETVKNPLIEVPQTSMSVVYKSMLDWAYSELKEYEMKQKYGDSDPRMWQKVFRNNPAPIPTNSTSEEWEKFYCKC